MARAQKGQQLRGGSRRLGLAAGPGRAVRGPGQAGRAARLLARLQGEPHDSVAARRTVYEAVQAELDAEIARRRRRDAGRLSGGGCASSCGCSNRTSARASRYSSRATCRPAGSRGPAPGAGARAARGTAGRRGARRATPRLAPRHRAGNGAAPGRGRRPGDPAGPVERTMLRHQRARPARAGPAAARCWRCSSISCGCMAKAASPCCGRWSARWCC